MKRKLSKSLMALAAAATLASISGIHTASAGGVGKLIRQNIKIYRCVGWEAGRMISIKKYGRAGDPGVCPSGWWLKR